MKRKRFSEEQIIAILREHEAGIVSAASTACRVAASMRGRRSSGAWTSPTPNGSRASRRRTPSCGRSSKV
jgi:hypothetical protein